LLVHGALFLPWFGAEQLIFICWANPLILFGSGKSEERSLVVGIDRAACRKSGSGISGGRGRGMIVDGVFHPVERFPVVRQKPMRFTSVYPDSEIVSLIEPAIQQRLLSRRISK
jgi:hypothetical protein